MKKSKLTASSIRTLMIIVIILLTVFVFGGFYYVQNWLGSYVTNSIATIPKSTSTKMTSQELTALQAELTKQKISISKAAAVTVPKNDYNSKIQQDLNRYATSNGIKITNYGPGEAPTSNSALPLTGGVKPGYISITVANPVEYKNLIKFIKAIETNLPKMRLTGVSLKRVDSPPGYVTIDPLNIEVYLR